MKFDPLTRVWSSSKAFPGDLLYLNSLPCFNRHLAGALALGYRFTGEDYSDSWTRRFNNFKTAAAPAITCNHPYHSLYHDSVTYAGRALAVALDSLDKITTCAPGRVLAVCVIPSTAHCITREHPVYRLAQTTSAALGWQFFPELLTKRVHRSLHDLRGPNLAATRDAEVRGAYRCAREIAALNVTHVAIFDDFITRGSTMEDCARAIRIQLPSATIFGVALGKAVRRAFEPDASNDHLRGYEKIWPITAPVPRGTAASAEAPAVVYRPDGRQFTAGCA